MSEPTLPEALRAEHHALHEYLVAVVTHAGTAAPYSDLVEAHDVVARIITAQADCDCAEMSWTGVDQKHLLDVTKVWRCDNCGRTGTTAELRPGPQHETVVSPEMFDRLADDRPGAAEGWPRDGIPLHPGEAQ